MGHPGHIRGRWVRVRVRARVRVRVSVKPGFRR